jgi:hypothetical protein
MRIRTEKLPWELDPRLLKILEEELQKPIEVDDGIIISFRDPDFTPEGGGFHPVEFALRKDGTLLYATDFCYVGSPPHCDLVKSLDFDFSLDHFRHLGMDFPLAKGRDAFQMFQSNFVAYHTMNAYQSTVEAW